MTKTRIEKEEFDHIARRKIFSKELLHMVCNIPILTMWIYFTWDSSFCHENDWYLSDYTGCTLKLRAVKLLFVIFGRLSYLSVQPVYTACKFI